MLAAFWLPGALLLVGVARPQIDVTASTKGHGLGLSIVRRAVQTMGGQAWAEPQTQGGAALCFSLPGVVLADGSQVSGTAADA